MNFITAVAKMAGFLVVCYLAFMAGMTLLLVAGVWINTQMLMP